MAEHHQTPHHPISTLWHKDEMVRRRLAQTLHGPVKNSLLFMHCEIEAVIAQIANKNDPAVERLRKLQTLVDNLSQTHIDPAISEAYPLIVQLGLMPSLRSLVSNRPNPVIDVQLQADAALESLDSPMHNRIPVHTRLGVYRIVEDTLELLDAAADPEDLETVDISLRLRGSPDDPQYVYMTMRHKARCYKTIVGTDEAPKPSWTAHALTRAKLVGATGNVETAAPYTTILRVVMPWDTIEGRSSREVR